MSTEILGIASIMASIMTPVILFYAFNLYRRDQREKMIIDQKRHQEELENRLKIAEDSKTSISISNETENRNNDGYIIIEVPENQKSMFHDFLKGFEEYAKLQGYQIRFSADNSIENRIAFKFTLGDSGIQVSTEKVRTDINEYIIKVKNGESFDDLPQLISPEEHSLVLTTLKNRINFLEHTHKLQKHTIQFYENLLNNVSGISNLKGISSTPTVFVQTGGNHSPKLNSGNTLNDNSDHSTKIKISKSFNTVREQITKLDELRKLIRDEENLDKESKEQISQDKQDEIVKNILTIKEQLETKEEPDENLIKENLKNTKKLMDGMVLTHKTAKAIEWLGESFEYLSNLNIPI